MTASIVGVIFSLVMCALSIFFSHTSFLTPNLLRVSLGTLLASVDMVVVGEHLGIWILWIFFLITAALVTVCSRPSSFSAVLTPCYRNNFLISNGAEVIIKSAAFLRLSKHSVGFAGVFYPSSSSSRLSSFCWTALGIEQIGVIPGPQHAKPPPLL